MAASVRKVAPDAIIAFAASAAHSGVSVGLPDALLSAGTIPHPKLSTSVRVCFSPPLFVTVIACPARMVNVWGTNCHDATGGVELSSSGKAVSVTVPCLVDAQSARAG